MFKRNLRTSFYPVIVDVSKSVAFGKAKNVIPKSLHVKGHYKNTCIMLNLETISWKQHLFSGLSNQNSFSTLNVPTHNQHDYDQVCRSSHIQTFHHEVINQLYQSHFLDHFLIFSFYMFQIVPVIFCCVIWPRLFVDLVLTIYCCLL